MSDKTYQSDRIELFVELVKSKINDRFIAIELLKELGRDFDAAYIARLEHMQWTKGIYEAILVEDDFPHVDPLGLDV